MIIFCISIITIYRHLTLQAQVNKLEQDLASFINNFDARVIEAVQKKYTVPSGYRNSGYRDTSNTAYSGFQGSANSAYGGVGNQGNSEYSESGIEPNDSSRRGGAEFLDLLNDTTGGEISRRPARTRYIREAGPEPVTTHNPNTMSCLCPPGEYYAFLHYYPV